MDAPPPQPAGRVGKPPTGSPGEGHPESGSIGALEWHDGEGAFAFVPDEDLRPFTRHNWKWV